MAPLVLLAATILGLDRNAWGLLLLCGGVLWLERKMFDLD
jgi:hypothetical protein